MDPQTNKLMNPILKHLQNDVYCRIGVSQIPEAGVGVVCIKTIPKGVNPFKTMLKHEKVVTIDEKSVRKLPKEIEKIIDDFYVSDGKTFGMCEGGPNAMPLSFYMNHSKKPNMGIYQTSYSDWTEFQSNKRIDPGEELTINYEDFDAFK